MTIYLLYIDINMTSKFFCFAWFVQGSYVLKKTFITSKVEKVLQPKKV